MIKVLNDIGVKWYRGEKVGHLKLGRTRLKDEKEPVTKSGTVWLESYQALFNDREGNWVAVSSLNRRFEVTVKWLHIKSLRTFGFYWEPRRDSR